MMHSQHVFGRVRFLQLHFGKAVVHSQQQDNKQHKESVTLNSVQWDCHRLKEGRELTACAHVLPVNLTVLVAEQDLSQGMMEDKQSWG